MYRKPNQKAFAAILAIGFIVALNVGFGVAMVGYLAAAAK